MWLLVACCIYFRPGAPIAATERAPRMRAPDATLHFVAPPPVAYDRDRIDLACHAALAPARSAHDPPPLTTLAALVAFGRARGGACAIAIDLAVEMHASNLGTAPGATHASPLETHAYWSLAGEAATSHDRRVAAVRNAALAAWHEAAMLVRSGLRAGAPFPLEPWLVAGDAFARAAVDDPRLVPFALDAYENALRASRQRDLSPAQAIHIAHALAGFRDDRARALRARIALPVASADADRRHCRASEFLPARRVRHPRPNAVAARASGS